MSRSKSFDPDVALRRAMQLFWRGGYEATSVDDLVAAMGINRASLYATFGDKRRLFLRALDRYIEQVLEARMSEFERVPEPIAGLRALLAELVAFSAGDPQRRGCLAVNTACELAGRDAEIAARLRVHAERMEELLAGRLALAQDRGEIGSAADPRTLARAVLAVIDGLRVRAKLGTDRATLAGIADTALVLLA